MEEDGGVVVKNFKMCPLYFLKGYSWGIIVKSALVLWKAFNKPEKNNRKTNGSKSYGVFGDNQVQRNEIVNRSNLVWMIYWGHDKPQVSVVFNIFFKA